MLSRISKNSKRILAILSQYRTPNQIAWGVACGVILGLLPKDNLIAVAMVCCLAFLRVNQLVGVATTILVSTLSDWIAPASLSLGSAVLNQPNVAMGIRRLYEIPLVPWTRLENPLVPGGLVIGTLSALPTFIICSLTFTQTKKLIDSDQLQKIANEAIQYRKVVLDQSVSRRGRSNPPLRVVKVPDEMSAIEDPPAIDALPVSGALPVTYAEQPVTDIIVQGAADNPASDFQRNDTTISKNIFPRLAHEEKFDSDTILRETVIEVVRFKTPQLKNTKPIAFTPLPDSHFDLPAQENSMSVSNLQRPISNSNVARIDDHSAANTLQPFSSSPSQDEQALFHPTSGEESLRYLISHINGTREQNRKALGKSHDVA